VAQSNLIRGFYPLKLIVYSSLDKTVHIPFTSLFIGNKPKLKLAGKFAKDLNEYITK